MGERVLGEIGSRVVFENERVRIWVLRLEPGEQSATHRHDLPHVLVQVAGDRIAVAPEPDSAGPFRDRLEAEVVAGIATYVDAGGIETALNVGTEPYREIIIELKDAPTT